MAFTGGNVRSPIWALVFVFLHNTFACPRVHFSWVFRRACLSRIHASKETM